MPERRIIEVKNEVPFGDSITRWCEKTKEPDLETLIEHSHHHDASFLAWEMVRKMRNPYFQNGTGFEGYFIGVYTDSEQVLKQLLKLGHEMLNNFTKLYPYDMIFKSKLLRTLTGEVSDHRAILEWTVELGAQLAVLRSTGLTNQEAQVFRSETILEVSELPKINYTEDRMDLKQDYILQGHDDLSGGKIRIETRQLNPLDQEAWLVAQSAGKFGHPIIREYSRFCVD